MSSLWNCCGEIESISLGIISPNPKLIKCNLKEQVLLSLLD